METVLQFLDTHNIVYTLHEHLAVFTCEEAKDIDTKSQGLHTKNLFLRNKNKTRYLLLSAPAYKPISLDAFAYAVGEKRLSFASPNDLLAKLGLKPGSVSPFGLINNTTGDVEYFYTTEVAEASLVGFHPNVNTATLDVAQEAFQKFLHILKNKQKAVAL